MQSRPAGPIFPPKQYHIEREKVSFPILKETCISQLRKLNPFLSDVLAQEVIGRICRISPTLEGNLIMWEYLKEKKSIYITDQRQERNIRLIKTNDLESNLFPSLREQLFLYVAKLG